MSKPVTKEPLVSIALCIYNGEEYLDQQLYTLVNQTYINLEIIIVDDRSTDGSIAIINKYTTDKRIKLFVNERNLGHVKNFEKAISYCTGEYIALADQDDIWDLNKIAIMTEKIGDSILIYHDSEFIDDNGVVLGKMSDRLNMYAGTRPLSLLFYNSVSGHSCLIKRELILKLGSFNPDFCHDWWIAFVAANAGKVTYIDQTLVKYRQHAQSSTDILRRKDEIFKNEFKYGEFNPVWLKACENISVKYQQLINKMSYLHQHKSLFNSFKLLYILMAHKRDLFFIKKKNTISTLNYIRKLGFFNEQNHYLMANPQVPGVVSSIH